MDAWAEYEAGKLCSLLGYCMISSLLLPIIVWVYELSENIF